MSEFDHAQRQWHNPEAPAAAAPAAPPIRAYQPAPAQPHPYQPAPGQPQPYQQAPPAPMRQPYAAVPMQGYLPYAVPIAPPGSGVSTASMVLGIIGLFASWFLFGIPSILAVILGHVGISDTKHNRRSGRGQAVAGLVLGYVIVVPGLLITLAIFGMIGAAAAASA
jgi:Domain of unknown function (DUF4190)